MSREEVRRPLRYLSEAELGVAPVPPVPRVDAATLARSGERFQRTLGAVPSRRTPAGVSRDNGRRDAAAAETAGAPAPAAKGAPAAPPAAAAPMPVASAAPVGAATPTTMDEADGGDVPVESPVERPDLGWWKGPAPAAAADAWPEQLADTIADLFRRADPAFVSWTVTVPMDPEVLPETELRLSLSPHWLSLRFAARSPEASHLLLRHRPRLQSLLERTPNLPHGIDIEIA